MKIKFILISISLLLLVLSLPSCRSNSDDFSSKIGKTVTVSGEIVKGPCGYMLFRGGDFNSVYLLPSPDGKPQEVEKKIAELAVKNVGKSITVTGRLYFHESNLPNKLPEESVTLPDDFYYIIWDSADTVIDFDSNQK